MYAGTQCVYVYAENMRCTLIAIFFCYDRAFLFFIALFRAFYIYIILWPLWKMYYCNNRDVFFSFCSLFFYGFAWNWMLWAVNKWNQVIIIPDNLFSFLFVRTRQKIQFHTEWTCGCSDVEANERARVCV